ncbi:putative monooxygenase [Neohortaea acidophila]|uniref:Putative monooxygenase n=1 Tax=Neohortaea acidophila TaxID=245834 RepID=A0A6A6PUG7_9PEZI|nr:putative monooxygenase [Neohortaea acidophila]KAF2483759.1 putative monooxygenase [Neohortaea acidophila]
MAEGKVGFRVLIVGGGNCGLAIATGLKKAGISYTVFERDTEETFKDSVRNWGMVLHWGTEYFEKLLPDHLLSRIEETRVDPSIDALSSVPQIKADTGAVMYAIPMPVANRVSRAKIRKLLLGDGLDIKFGKKLQSISVEGPGVSLAFDDGIVESGDMVIGCDGPNSVVRKFLVGAEAAQGHDVGGTMINAVGEGYSPAEARLLRSPHPIMQLGYDHPAVDGAALVAALDIPDPQDPAQWKFQAYTSWAGPPYAKDLQDPKERMTYVRERMAHFCEPFRTAFLALAEDKVLPVYAANQWAPRTKWDNYRGRVTLAGDAAHSMLPNRGQGLNNALKDASDLVDAIKAAVASGSSDLSEGITVYEEEMRARGTKEVDLSYEAWMTTRNKKTFDSPLFKFGYTRT